MTTHSPESFDDAGREQAVAAFISSEREALVGRTEIAAKVFGAVTDVVHRRIEAQQ